MKGILLINLGSPNSTQVKDVRIYLREFLMDKRVIDVPWILRKMIVELGILPKRPQQSAKLYESIWWKEGSPLVVISQRVKEKLQNKVNIPVALAMRYQYPSIKQGIQELADKGVNEVLVIPLYPQYAMSTTETVVEKVKEVSRKYFKKVNFEYLPPFYKDKEYLKVLASSIKEKLPQDIDLLLFSYHGVPERHILKTDAFGQCKIGDCCFQQGLESHKFCYRHQCYYTTEEIRKLLGLEKSKVKQTFQSRLGKNPWLRPYTDETLAKFPPEGIKKIAVIAPAFVSDCLETLEEIATEGKHIFLENGGTEFTYIECINDKEQWIDFLKLKVYEFILKKSL